MWSNKDVASHRDTTPNLEFVEANTTRGVAPSGSSIQGASTCSGRGCLEGNEGEKARE